MVFPIFFHPLQKKNNKKTIGFLGKAAGDFGDDAASRGTASSPKQVRIASNQKGWHLITGGKG